MKKAILIDAQRVPGEGVANLVGESLEWPTVEGFEIVICLRLGEIQGRLSEDAVRDRIADEKVSAILLASHGVLRELKFSDLLNLIALATPEDFSGNVEDWPMVAVLTKNTVSGPEGLFAFRFNELTALCPSSASV